MEKKKTKNRTFGIAIEKSTHELLVKYCDEKALKIGKFVDKLILDKLKKEKYGNELL